MNDSSRTYQKLLDQISALHAKIQELEHRLEGSSSPSSQNNLLSDSLVKVCLENAPDGVYMSDIHGNFLYGNRKCEEITGYNRNELIGRNFLTAPILAEKSLAKATALLEASREGKSTGPDEIELMTREGRVVPVEITTSFVPLGGQKIIIGFVRDISQHKKVERASKESQTRLSRIIEFLPDPTFAVDSEGSIIAWNRAIEEMTGYSAGQMLGKGNYEYAIPFYGERRPMLVDLLSSWDNSIAERYPFLQRDGHTLFTEMNLSALQGQTRWLWVKASPLRDQENRMTGAIESIRDITSQKRAEETLRNSESKYHELYALLRLLADTMPDMLWAKDLDKRFVFANKAICEKLLHAHDTEEPIGKTDLFFAERERAAHPDDPCWHTFGEMCQDSDAITVENMKEMQFDEFGNVRGTFLFLDVRKAPLVNRNSDLIGVVGSARDMTARKTIEDELNRRSEAMAASIDGMAILNENEEYVYVNDAHGAIYGYDTGRELLGKTWKALYDDDEIIRFETEIMPTLRTEGKWHGEAMGRRKNGSRFPQEVSLTGLKDGGLICVVRDITERKQMENVLRESEAQYKSLTERMSDMLWTCDLNLKTTYANPSLERLLGFTLEERLGQPITDQVTPETLRLAQNILADELGNDALRDPERQMVLTIEYYHKDGTVRYQETSLTFVRDNNGRPIGIQGLSRDISERKRAEEALERSTERLHKALGATVGAIAAVVETRDPYTAGHQRKVADLARSIAHEMGLPNDRADGLRMAAAIHDIGKISVPVEILSKPSQLTAIEFGLIKIHPRSGYDILKDVDFPWPIARMVLEHHERMNGSGYPEGLKGDMLLVESRILAVADVVESMASHRPYRPAIGVVAALEEIEKNSGILYDPDVVAACQRLFSEKGYKIVE